MFAPPDSINCYITDIEINVTSKEKKWEKKVGCTSFARTGNKSRLIDGKENRRQVLWCTMKGSDVKVQ